MRFRSLMVVGVIFCLSCVGYLAMVGSHGSVLAPLRGRPESAHTVGSAPNRTDVSWILHLMNTISSEDIDREAMAQRCKIDELHKDHGMAAHSCLSDAECNGKRTCTTFGWCRGKALCTPEEVTKACSIDEPARTKLIKAKDATKSCLTDDDCLGTRVCDDDQEWICTGDDSLC